MYEYGPDAVGHNEWWPPEVAESTRRRICFMRASSAARSERRSHGGSGSVLLRTGRAQEEYYGLCAVGGAGSEAAERETAVRHIYAGTPEVGGLAAGVRSNPRGHGIDGGLLEAGVEHSGGT